MIDKTPFSDPNPDDNHRNDRDEQPDIENAKEKAGPPDDPFQDLTASELDAPFFDPTNPEMLVSRNGRDVPSEPPFYFIHGTKHPNLEDLTEYTQMPESGSITLPATIPLLNEDRSQPLSRVPHYGVDVNFPSKYRATHLMAVGTTGSGKNIHILNPLRYSAIADPQHIVVSISLKASDFGPIQATCRMHGKRLVVINLNDADRSAGYNPLAGGDADSHADAIRRYADSMRNPLSHDSEFWTQIMRMALQGGREEGYLSFPAIADLYDQSRKELLEELKKHDNPHSAGIHEFFASGNTNADTCWATIRGAFTPFAQTQVRRVMSRDELEMDRLFQQPVCLHIEVSESKLETQLPLVQLLVRDVMDRLIEVAERAGEERALPATIFIDDLPSLGNVLNESRLLTLRQRKIGVVAGVQNLQSLQLVCGDGFGRLVHAFANHIVLPGCAQEDAEYFSRASGDQMVACCLTSEAQPMNRYLLSPADIRSPSSEHFLLGKPVTFFLGPLTFQAYLQRWYETPIGARIMRAARGVTGRETLRKKSLPDPWSASGDSRRKKRDSGGGDGPTGISDTRGWSNEQVEERLRVVLERLDYPNTTSSAKNWWDTFQEENQQRLGLVLRLAEELAQRQATVTEFYLAYVHSNTDNIQANLFYLDYTRLKKEDERRKREAAAKALKNGGKSEDQA